MSTWSKGYYVTNDSGEWEQVSSLIFPKDADSIDYEPDPPFDNDAEADYAAAREFG